ncbi:uncharacterized protein [Spinacia oleracea]|uniref:Reverse transcriptase domain-containing protein n=1 Tax=Spinacia oleracea TaxID=3562 RepID=A0ABM3QYL6_SPIOL|nr:uncharacterized protein LOC130463355 [Spinacia oleracea]
MAVDERIGAPVRQSDIVDISNCFHNCGMEDIKSVGNFFTWNNKQQGTNRVFSKIDRFMANQAWQGIFPAAEVCFMPEGHFDHSPGLLTVYPRSDGGRKPFKYFTMWKSSPVFSETVKKAWSSHIDGSKMFRLVCKLKKVKQALRELNKVGFTDVQGADLKAYQEMVNAQSALHRNPTDASVADAELKDIQEYKEKHKAYLAFLSQKAKVNWLKEGDENTALFHQSIKARRVQNQVYSICDMTGNWKDTTDEEHHKSILNAPYTADEVKSALFSIPGVKAPGPDGFGSYFYKDAWHVAGDEVIAAILDMLQNGKLLKEVNHTVITLIPKTKCPKDVSEFRPISCCNTIYKCITKVLCGRLRQVLPDLILENQGGFVHGRFIVHNIMVVQDLVKHYGRKAVKPSCLMKIDLQKAYDTVDWQFLYEMLTYLEFPCSFVKMFHPRCKDIKLTHLCFADDLILCSKGDYQSILLLLQAFKLFSNSAGLKANQQKSSVYCHGMPESEVQRVVDVSSFSRSSLPFKYLGVPICSKKITVAQCGHLVDKMITRIKI